MTMSDVSTVDLLGVPVHSVSLDEAVDRIATMIANRSFGHVATANVDFLQQADTDASLRQILNQADLVVADGVPLLWMARWQGTPLPERVNGTDLTVRLCELAPERQWRVCMVGGDVDVAQRAANTVAHRYGLQVVGVRSPTRSAMDDPVASAELADWIAELDTDLLLLAIGGGRQERWIDEHRDRLGACVAMGVGSALDFIAGTRRRAPQFMQEHGFEWAWRLGSEPSRLWRRYLVDDTQLLARYARSRLVKQA
jgi:N-acetylglucosaminyldiphosphoundecaprenol N-acetyl-beta-D-mannosaminyltransferase